MERIICIGGSTGAPAGLTDLLSSLPAGLRVPILVALHMPGSMTTSFARTLAGRTPFRVVVANSGDRPEPGCVYLGPGGRHLGVGAGGRLVLSTRPEELHFKPSIDVLFYTAARVFKRGVVAVVLTGLTAKRDAVEGALAVRKARGEVIVIDDPASRFLGLPKSVIDAGAATRVVGARDLAAEVARRAR